MKPKNGENTSEHTCEFRSVCLEHKLQLKQFSLKADVAAFQVFLDQITTGDPFCQLVTCWKYSYYRLVH